jgi:hypothetical protein
MRWSCNLCYAALVDTAHPTTCRRCLAIIANWQRWQQAQATAPTVALVKE